MEGALSGEGGNGVRLGAGDLEGNGVGDAVEHGGGYEVGGVLVTGKDFLGSGFCEGGALCLVEALKEVGGGDGCVGLEGWEVGDECGVDLCSVVVDDGEIYDDDGGAWVVFGYAEGGEGGAEKEEGDVVLEVEAGDGGDD